MSENKAKGYLLNAIYNLEKNVKSQPPSEFTKNMIDIVLEQLKSTLEELSDNWKFELKSLGLSIP